MADDSTFSTFKPTSNSDEVQKSRTIKCGNIGRMRRLVFPSEKGISTLEEPSEAGKLPTLLHVTDDSNSCTQPADVYGALVQLSIVTSLKATNAVELSNPSSDHRLSASEGDIANKSEDKENSVAMPSSNSENTQETESSGKSLLNGPSTASEEQCLQSEHDAQVVRRAQEEGCVSVVFSGTVTPAGCCCFVSEILKCILYQRQQLPMMYDQLVYSQKKQQSSLENKDMVSRKPLLCADIDQRKCQRTLQELEDVLQQLEVLFTISKVPRVLLLMGGSLVLPKELYEINMEGLVLASGDQCLRVSSCLRQIFRTLFVADLLSDTKPVRLMPTTVFALAHRDCGVSWFRPKLQFKVPTCIKNQIIALSTDPSLCLEARAEKLDWQEYVWFQAPMTIKGFNK